MDAGAILVMGVCGTGKTTVAQALAAEIGGDFVEADDLHPASNIERMSRGVPLTDGDRLPWLELVCNVAERKMREGRPVVVACSALKRRYRELIRSRLGEIAVIHLSGEPQLIRTRMAHRRGHFMPPALLESQLAELEPPDGEQGAATVDVGPPLEEVVAAARSKLSLLAGPALDSG